MKTKNLIANYTRVDQAIELLAAEGREFCSNLEPFELDKYCSDDLENIEFSACKLRLAAEILLKRANELETMTVDYTSELWAARPRD